jgi:hypothetical protein
MFKRFTAGVAVGYVMGARAGQKRYDEITELADRALDIPFVEHLVDSGRSMAMDQGRRMLAGLKDRAQWNPSDSSRSSDEREDSGGDDADDRYEDEAEDFEPQDSDDEISDDEISDDEAPDGEDDQDEDEAGDFQAEQDHDVGDVGDDADDVGDDQFVDDEDDEEEEDEVRDSEPEEERATGRSRRRIGALASAARDRGRVD